MKLGLIKPINQPTQIFIGHIVQSRLNTTNRLPHMGQGAFVRLAATMLSGSRPCLIAFQFEPSHAKRDASIRGYENQVQPGEGVVDA